MAYSWFRRKKSRGPLEYDLSEVLYRSLLQLGEKKNVQHEKYDNSSIGENSRATNGNKFDPHYYMNADNLH